MYEVNKDWEYPRVSAQCTAIQYKIYLQSKKTFFG